MLVFIQCPITHISSLLWFLEQKYLSTAEISFKPSPCPGQSPPYLHMLCVLFSSLLKKFFPIMLSTWVQSETKSVVALHLHFKLIELFSFCFWPGYVHFPLQALLPVNCLSVCNVCAFTVTSDTQFSVCSRVGSYLTLLIIKHYHYVFPFSSSELRPFCLIQTSLQGPKVKFPNSLSAPASCLPLS